MVSWSIFLENYLENVIFLILRVDYDFFIDWFILLYRIICIRIRKYKYLCLFNPTLTRKWYKIIIDIFDPFTIQNFNLRNLNACFITLFN